jgi:primosomal protein N' (replication factor Y)
MIAKIAVSAARFSMDKPYSYRFGEEMRLVPGVRVMVPFGNGNRRTEGVVLSVENGDESKLKSVDQALDPVPLITPQMLRLAAFIRERYFCTFYEAIRVMLPAGLWFREVERFSLVEGACWEESQTASEEMKAICAKKLAHITSICRSVDKLGL